MMAFVIMGVSVLCYLALVVVCSRKAVAEFSFELSQDLVSSSTSFKNLVVKKDSLNQEKIRIKDELYKIFTLYEITRDITKKIHQDDAFAIFSQKLNEHIVLKECRLFPSDSKVKDEMPASASNVYVFPLQFEKKSIGYLSVSGLSSQDQEKFTILAHQFALAARRSQLYEQVEKIAITDALTDLFNRRYLMQRLEEEFERAKNRKIKLSVLMVDVDHFKKINDEFGHLTGDQVLRQTAKVIKDNIREIDIAGRYGGEEFCIILPDTDIDGVQYAAERIRTAMSKAAIKAYDNSIPVTVSIGAATFPKDTLKIHELIDKADQALYKAKESGRNKVEIYNSHKKT